MPQESPPGRPSHSLFFALVPDAVARERIRAAVERLRLQLAIQGRWVRPERYHLTLHYLGGFAAFPDDLAARARDAAAGVDAGGFEIVLDRAGHFGRGVGWLGTAEAGPGLTGLWRSLGSALAGAGIRAQGHDAFVPHLTIVRDLRRDLPSGPIEPTVWAVRELLLIDSRLGDYVVIDRWPLRRSGVTCAD